MCPYTYLTALQGLSSLFEQKNPTDISTLSRAQLSLSLFLSVCADLYWHFIVRNIEIKLTGHRYQFG